MVNALFENLSLQTSCSFSPHIRVMCVQSCADVWWPYSGTLSAAAGHLLAPISLKRLPQWRPQTLMLTNRVSKCAGGIGKAAIGGGRGDYGGRKDGGSGKLLLPFIRPFSIFEGRKDSRREVRHHAPTRCYSELQ